MALEHELGDRITGLRSLSGGEVNHAVLVEFATRAEPVVLKWHPDPPFGLFDAEADGLEALSATKAVRIPSVLLVSTEPAFLVLEFIPSAPTMDESAFSVNFAEALAALHRSTVGGVFGHEIDNYLGSQPQCNVPSLATWSEFYHERRLQPQIVRAKARGILPVVRERALARVVDRLPDLLRDMPNESSLIHGDLWAGNYLRATGDEPALIDPAVYNAPREMEIAYIELFGGFPQNFVRHYDAAYPLDSGYSYRRSLHQIYPLLIHLNHFGEQYGPAVDRAVQEYL